MSSPDEYLSFAYVADKYGLITQLYGDRGSANLAVNPGLRARESIGEQRLSEPVYWMMIILASVPFIGLTFVFAMLTLTPLNPMQGPCRLGEHWYCFGIDRALIWTSDVGAWWGLWSNQHIAGAAAGIVVVAFLGAYLRVARMFLQSIVSFDLGPVTFLRAARHLLLGTVLALIFWRSFVDTSFVKAIFYETNDRPAELPPSGVWIGLSFLIGYYADLGILTTFRWIQIRWFKIYDRAIAEQFPGIPTDVLDGIDQDVKDRLEEHYITDVQNLATYNPVMLFVETPYGLYQCIDWVAQAQLCCAVGPRAYAALRTWNIRTIFDLERAIFNEWSTPGYRQLVARIVLHGDDNANLVALLQKKNGEIDDEVIRHAITVIGDDLHVHRLRQVWNVVSRKLSPKHMWLQFTNPELKNWPNSLPPPPSA